MRVLGAGCSIAICFWLAEPAALGQAVCSPETFAKATTDPVTIEGDVLLDAGCSLDFGDRALIVQGTIHCPSLTLSAGRITVGAGGAIIASAAAPNESGGFISVHSIGDILVQGDLLALGGLGSIGGEVSLESTAGAIVTHGLIDVSGGITEGGIVTLRAAARIDAEGSIRSAGACQEADCTRSGKVSLEAGTILSLTGPVDASGADGGEFSGQSEGGEVTLFSGDQIVLASEVDLRAGHWSRGGSFRALSTGDAVQKSGTIRAEGRFDDGAGGAIRLQSVEGKVEFHGALRAGGGSTGGSGSVEIDAETDVIAAGEISNTANFPAGSVSLFSSSGSIALRSSIDATGKGDFGTGGSIEVDALDEVLLTGAQLEASGAGPDGLGGSIRVSALGRLEASNSRLRSDGDGADPKIGAGGLLDLLGCEILITSSTLETRGETGGRIFLTASSSSGIALSGSAEASAGGLIVLAEPPGTPPELAGGKINPDPVLEENGDPAPCFGGPSCDPSSDLACQVAGTSVSLVWRRGLGQDGTRILRDGSPLVDLEGSRESYDDAGVPAGRHTYSVQGLCGGRSAATAPTCELRVGGGASFIRGNYNQDEKLDISDPLAILGCLFLGQGCQPCREAGDANDDNAMDISDPLHLLNFLFLGGKGLAPPYPGCGADGTPDPLGCDAFAPCR